MSFNNSKSAHSRYNSYLRFINGTNRMVDVIWLNYEGQRVKYHTLHPTEHYDVNTFVTHPWIFRDSNSRAKLLASKNEIYQPKFWLNYIPQEERNNEGLRPRRITVKITLPVYTLKDRCLEVVRSLLSDPEAVNDLNIPLTLKSELKQNSI